MTTTASTAAANSTRFCAMLSFARPARPPQPGSSGRLARLPSATAIPECCTRATTVMSMCTIASRTDQARYMISGFMAVSLPRFVGLRHAAPATVSLRERAQALEGAAIIEEGPRRVLLARAALPGELLVHVAPRAAGEHPAERRVGGLPAKADVEEALLAHVRLQRLARVHATRLARRKQRLQRRADLGQPARRRDLRVAGAVRQRLGRMRAVHRL